MEIIHVKNLDMPEVLSSKFAKHDKDLKITTSYRYESEITKCDQSWQS